MEVKSAVEAAVQRALPATLLFDHPTLSQLHAFLAPQAAVLAPSLPLAPARPQPTSSCHVEILSHRLLSPCDVMSSTLTVPDAITPIPLSRWDVEHESLHMARPPVRFGGFLSNVEAFDAAAFGISHPEALLLDVQQRMLLTTTAEVRAVSIVWQLPTCTPRRPCTHARRWCPTPPARVW